MLRKNILLFVLLCFTFLYCKTAKVGDETLKVTEHQKVLGAIGEHKDFILEQSYKSLAFPKYEIPIKLNFARVFFTKKTFEAYSTAKVRQKAKFKVTYVDSVKEKPYFLKIELADKVEIINALNKKTNKKIKEHLYNKNEAHIISSISIAMSQNDMDMLINADEVFLEHEGINSYAIKAYTNKELIKTLLFNEGVVFAYKTSSFCWLEDGKHQLKVVDISSDYKCPKGTSKSAKNAKKKIDYFKF